jgi:WD40 repeat protein
MAVIAKLPRKLHTLLSLSLLLLALLQIRAQPQITIQSGHRGMIRCLALSTDEKYLASAGADKTVIVWDVELRKKVLTFTGHENWIVALEFGPVSETPLLASGGYDGTVRVWNLKTARLEHEITSTRPYSITSLDFSPAGDMLAIATGSKISVWNVKTRTMQTVLEGHRGPVTKVFYGRDNYIFSSSLDRTLRIWNVTTGEQQVTEPEKYGVAGMTVDPSTRLFAVAYNSGGIKIRNIEEKKEVDLAPSFPEMDIRQGIGFRQYRLGRFVKTTLSSTAIVFLPNGRLAYTDGFKIRIWDYSSQVTQEVVDIESSVGSTSLVFSKKQNSIFYDDGVDVKAVELNFRKPDKLGNSYGANFDMISLGLKGQVLLAGGFDGALIMTTDGKSTLPRYKAESLAPLVGEFPIDFDHSTDLTGQGLRAEISGTNILLKKESNKGPGQKTDKLYDTLVAVLKGQHKIKKCWKDTWDNYIVCSTADSKVPLWDVKARKAVRVFEGNPKAARFSDDLEYLAIAEEETLKIWKLKNSAAPPTDIKVDVHRVLAFSPYNKFIATEVIGGTRADIVETPDTETNINVLWASALETLNKRPRVLKIWDVGSGSQLGSLPMQTAQAIDYTSFSTTKVTLDPIIYNLLGWIKPYISPSGPISFSADGNLIAYDEVDMLSGTSRIRVWNLSTKKEECVFEGHTSSIRRIIFSPDSNFVLSSGWDNTLKIWGVTSKDLKATILTSKDGWVIFTPEGRFDTDLNLRKANDLTWQWSEATTRPLPLRVFLRDYYEPRLLRKILRNELLNPVRDLTSLNVTQPQVAIRDVQPDGPDSVKVTVEVGDVESDFQRSPQGRSLHSGVFDVRLLRNDQVVAQSTSDTSINEFLNQIKPLDAAAPDRFERELDLWRSTHRVSLDANGKATLIFEHIKLPKNSAGKEVDFTAYAFNSDRVTSELSPPFKYRLPASLPRAKPRAYILTIGVDTNESGWNLSFAAASANEIQKSIAAKVGKEYDVIKVSLLSTFTPESFRPALTQVRKENVRAVLDILAGRFVSPEEQQRLGNVNALKPAAPDDLVFIYIASHGFSDPQGNFFIIPYNSGRFYGVSESKLSDCIAGKAKGTICDDSKKFIANSISSNELANWLQGVDAGKIYMILDSCYSAAAPGSNFKPGPLGDRTFGQLAYDKGMTILTASQQSALSPMKLNGTLLSRTLTELMEKSPESSLLYLLEETEFTVPQKYQTLFPKNNAGIQYPVLFDFSETEN